METILQQGVVGISIAAVYAMFAIGFVLIFGVLDVLNLAYAYVFAFTAELTVSLSNLGVPILGAIAVSILCGGILGLFTGLVSSRDIAGTRMIGGINFAPMILTLGAGMIIQAFVEQIFGTTTVSFASNPFFETTWRFGGVIVSMAQLMVVVVAVVVIAAMALFLKRTAAGRAIRAVADNRPMAALSGINVRVVVLGVWALSSALAGLAGGLISVLDNAATSSMGGPYELRGFIVVILGGLGSVIGSVLAAAILAAIETVAIVTIGSEFQDVLVLGLVLLLLAFRPNGLVGRRTRTV
jgi:branched-chain amino acid transport system permease protein